MLGLTLTRQVDAKTSATRPGREEDHLRCTAGILRQSTPERSSARSDLLSGPTTARVRSTDRAILDLLAEGNDRSATFRGLTDAIAHTDGIVYIEFGYCALGHLNGCLLPFLATTRRDRYLRLVITPDKNQRSHNQLLALVAHEMQHAVEVLGHQEVVDVPTMEAMYRKMGTPLKGGLTGYETSAARTAGDAVLAELSKR